MSQRQPQDLASTLRAVDAARSALDQQRTRGSMQGVATSEQRALLVALEAHADALTREGHPMPYRMRRDLAMYRAMCETPRGRAR